jgi:hypothetical protein
VIEIMRDGGNSAGIAATIFDDCYYASKEFAKVEYEHVQRKANHVAHELARMARFSNPSIWMEIHSTDIVPLLIKDVTLILNE